MYWRAQSGWQSILRWQCLHHSIYRDVIWAYTSSSLSPTPTFVLCSQICSQHFSLKMQPSSAFDHLADLQLITRFRISLPSCCTSVDFTPLLLPLGLGVSLPLSIAKDVVNEFWFLLSLMLSLLFRKWSRKITDWAAFNPYTQSSIQTRVGQVIQVRLIRRFTFLIMVLGQERTLTQLYLIKSHLGLTLEWLG